MNWIILVPRGAEYQAVLRGLAKRRSSATSGATTSGATTISAIAIPAGLAVRPWLTTQFAAQFAAQFDSPSQTQILIMGLCGGLSDRTRVGTVVIYEHSANTSELTQRLGIQSVRGMRIDRVLCLASEKQELARDAEVVDMESQWIVEYLEPLGFVVRVIRVVSDDARGDLPDLSAAFDRSGDLRPGALAIAFIKNPIAALRLVRGSLTALKRLEGFVAELDLEHLRV